MILIDLILLVIVANVAVQAFTEKTERTLSWYLVLLTLSLKETHAKRSHGKNKIYAVTCLAHSTSCGFVLD